MFQGSEAKLGMQICDDWSKYYCWDYVFFFFFNQPQLSSVKKSLSLPKCFAFLVENKAKHHFTKYVLSYFK